VLYSNTVQEASVKVNMKKAESIKGLSPYNHSCLGLAKGQQRTLFWFTCDGFNNPRKEQ